jgi:hypothetical protein
MKPIVIRNIGRGDPSGIYLAALASMSFLPKQPGGWADRDVD